MRRVIFCGGRAPCGKRLALHDLPRTRREVAPQEDGDRTALGGRKMKSKVCQKCGAGFYGAKNARFCEKCRKERQREVIARWREEHKDKVQAYNREKQKRYYSVHREEILSKRKAALSKGKVPTAQETPKAPAFVSVCKNFRPDVVACVLCAGTGAEKYKACYVEVTK